MKPSSKLQAKWDKKLKESGFEDIEDKDGNLKEWTTSKLANGQRHIPVSIESKTEYYRLASHFLHDYESFNDSTRKMWELHSQGVSIRDIADYFKSKKIDRNVVHGILRDLTAKMLKRYTTNHEQSYD